MDSRNQPDLIFHQLNMFSSPTVSWKLEDNCHKKLSLTWYLPPGTSRYKNMKTKSSKTIVEAMIGIYTQGCIYNASDYSKETPNMQGLTQDRRQKLFSLM